MTDYTIPMLQINASLTLLTLFTVMCYTGPTLLEYDSYQLRSANRLGLETSHAIKTQLSEAGILKKPAHRGTTAGKKHYSHIPAITMIWSITLERNELTTLLRQPGSDPSNLIRVKTTTADRNIKPQVLFCLVNARSVKNKATTIHQFIVDNDLDILVVTETWLHSGGVDGHIISALTPPGYTVRHVARPTGYGGVAVIHRSSLTLSAREDFPTATTYECLCLDITSKYGTDVLFIGRHLQQKMSSLPRTFWLNFRLSLTPSASSQGGYL